MLKNIMMSFLFIFYFILLTSFSKNDLPSLEINGNYITPKNGISLFEAKMLIMKRLEEDSIKGDILSNIQLNEITTKEAWENAGIQLYRVVVKYAWIDGVAIIKNNEVLAILSGMPTLSIFLADLDKDEVYEVYLNIAFGSGIIDYSILGFNVVLKENYILSNRQKQYFTLFISENTLMAKVHTWATKDTENKKVILKKENSKFVLTID